MSKTSIQPTVEAASAAPAVSSPDVSLSLTEFCTRLSETVRRPELIGAFEHIQKAAGGSRATEAEFRSRFTAFINKPI